MLSQLISGATYIHGNTLDLICTNSPELFSELNVIEPGLSNHYFISTNLDIRLRKTKKRRFHYQIVQKGRPYSLPATHGKY